MLRIRSGCRELESFLEQPEAHVVRQRDVCSRKKACQDRASRDHGRALLHLVIENDPEISASLPLWPFDGTGRDRRRGFAGPGESVVENLTFAGALRLGEETMAVLGGGAKAHGERRRAFARVRCALLIRLVYAVCFSLQDTGVSGAGKKPRQEVRCRDGHSDVFGMQLREGRERRRTLIVSRPEYAGAFEKLVLGWPHGMLEFVC